MTLSKLFAKYQHNGIEDYGCVDSPEMKTFFKEFKSSLKNAMTDVNIDIKLNHYYFSGFITKGDKTVYISYSVPRGGFAMELELPRFLVREAKDTHDYSGGRNQYSSLLELPSMIYKLL